MAPGGVIAHWRSHRALQPTCREKVAHPSHMRSNSTVALTLWKSYDSRTAGYDCVNNATVRGGRVWLPKQHHLLSDTQKPWGGHPSVCAGPLTTSLRGLWVSGILPPGNGGTHEGAATPKPTM